MPSLELILAFLQPQVILFLLFGVGALATALTMLLHPNPVRAALFLVLNLFCVAVLYLLLNAYFLAAVQVVVYAGAIMVLFLFVIMLLNLGTPDRTQDRLRIQQPLAAIAGLILAGSVAVTLIRTMALPVLDAAGNPPRLKVAKGPRAIAARSMSAGRPEGASQSETGTMMLQTPDSPEASASVATAENESNPASEQTESGSELPTQVSGDPNTIPTPQQGTVAGVGRALYNPNLPYLFPFEVTSILLLIATIGSVVLAQRKTPAEKSLDAEDLI